MVTEPTTPLNNADQGGSFCIQGVISMNSDNDYMKIKPPEQVEIFQKRNLYKVVKVSSLLSTILKNIMVIFLSGQL